ncbi:MAG: hypothetical protein RL092_1545 [Bacteroidota bacterium]|jgi:hypothetical protein
MQSKLNRLKLMASVAFVTTLFGCTPQYDTEPSVYVEVGYVFMNDSTFVLDTVVRPIEQRLSIKFYNKLGVSDVISISRNKKEIFIADTENVYSYRYQDAINGCWTTRYPLGVCWENGECFYMHSPSKNQWNVTPEIMYLTQDNFDPSNNFCHEYFIFTKAE